MVHFLKNKYVEWSALPSSLKWRNFVKANSRIATSDISVVYFSGSYFYESLNSFNFMPANIAQYSVKALVHWYLVFF